MQPGVAATPPDRPAVILADTGDTVTHGELEAVAMRFARALHERGLTQGGIVAVLADNVAETFAVHRAAVGSGLYVVPVDPDLSLEEIAYVVNDSGARALVVSARRSELASALLRLTPTVEARYVFGGALEHHVSFEATVAESQGRWPVSASGAELVYTSGITGRPRGVALAPSGSGPYRDALSMVLRRSCGIGPATVYFSTVPLSQAFALQVVAEVLAAGGTVVTAARWSAAGALEAIERHRVTVAQCVPVQLSDLLALPAEVRRARDVSSLGAVLHTGAPCPQSVKRRMLAWLGPIVHEFYSCTERNGFTFAPADVWQGRPGTVGRAEVGVLHVCGDDGDELPAGVSGTIYFERSQTPFVYHNCPEWTSAALHRLHPNWTTVGDVGRVDADGYLYLADRKSFMVTSGGAAWYPREVEDALIAHPAVADAAVIGVPDGALGERLQAVVRVRDGVKPAPGLERELLRHAEGAFTAGEVPLRVDFVADVPRTAAGKLAKRTLARRYALMDSVTG